MSRLAKGCGTPLLRRGMQVSDGLPEGFSHGSLERYLQTKPTTRILLKLTKIKYRFRDGCWNLDK